MADEPASPPQPSSRTNRLILMGGIGLSLVFVIFAALTIVVIKVGKVHDIWCKRVGTFCVKEPVKPPPVPAVPGGCPDYKMKGSLSARGSDDPAWDMTADVVGKISMRQTDTGADGKSTIACFNGQFLATFSDMSNGVLYQCLGSIDGRTYNGSCNVSFGNRQNIAGTFTN